MADQPAYVLAASDAVLLDDLQQALSAARSGTEAWDRAIKQLNEIHRISIRDSSPSRGVDALLSAAGQVESWDGRVIQVTIWRDVVDRSRMWTVNLTVRDFDYLLRVVGHGASEVDARADASAILADLGWTHTLDHADECVSSRPDAHVTCVASCGGDDAPSCMGYGATFRDAMAAARRQVRERPEWAGKSPRYSFIRTRSRAFGCTASVRLAGDVICVMADGSSESDARREVMVVLNDLGWTGALRGPQVLSLELHDKATDVHTYDLEGGKHLVVTDGALLPESRDYRRASRQFGALFAGPFAFTVYASLTLIDIYGVIHSFTSHEVATGWIALLVPPFGVYMGCEGLFFHA